MVLIRHTHKYLCARECFISLKLFLFCLPPVEVNHFSTNSHFLSSSFLSPKESQWACLWQSLERRISNLGSSHTWHRSLLFSFLKEIKLLRNLISPRRNKTSILLIQNPRNHSKSGLSASLPGAQGGSQHVLRVRRPGFCFWPFSWLHLEADDTS